MQNTEINLLKELELLQNAVTGDSSGDVHIFDGFHLLHSLRNVPDSYSKISRLIFRLITAYGKEAHIIFDKYKQPSIKDYEHRLRQENNVSRHKKTE